MDEFGEWGDVAPRLAEEGAPALEEARRRRLSPEDARPPWGAVSSLSFSSSSSLIVVPEEAPLMARPPGRLLAGGGPGILMGPVERPIGEPTGMDEGRAP
jgi:hypothetical protein